LEVAGRFSQIFSTLYAQALLANAKLLNKAPRTINRSKVRIGEIMVKNTMMYGRTKPLSLYGMDELSERRIKCQICSVGPCLLWRCGEELGI
jgi:hypothetical protein